MANYGELSDRRIASSSSYLWDDMGMWIRSAEGGPAHSSFQHHDNMSAMSSPGHGNAIGLEDSFYRSQFNGTEIGNEPQGQAVQDGTVSEHSAAQSAPKTASNYVPFLDRLRTLPEVRAIPWRPGQELPPERAVDSPRVQQRGATLLSTRGAVAATPCDHCAAGYGRFSVSVTLEQWFQGACSSCIFTSKGNKCSLRTQTSGQFPSIF